MDERDRLAPPGTDDFEDTQILLPEELAPAAARPEPELPSRPALVPPRPAGTRPPAARPSPRDTREIMIAGRARWHPAPWLVAGLAAGAGLAGLVWLLVVAFAPGSPELYPTAETGRQQTARAAVERLRDRGGDIVLHPDGRLEGLEGVGPNVRRAVAETLRQGAFPSTPELDAQMARLRAPAPTEPAGTARPLAPVGVRVLVDQPRFTWSDDPAALDYQVIVVDLLGNRIAESPRLRALAWEPARPLPRGRPLAWRLDTRVRRGEDAPPPAEARFALLTAEDLAWLERESLAARDSYLVTAVLTAELGALDDCHAALVGLARLNPRAPVVGKLLADLQAKRGR